MTSRVRANHAATSTISASLSPGQCRLSPPSRKYPVPSRDQNVPNDASITPTPYFSVFSGMRDSGVRRATPSATTTMPATMAPAIAIPSASADSPKVTTMKTTSTPSRKTPLSETMNANRSMPAYVVRSASRAASVCSAYSSSSLCSALRPAARRHALRSHCRPKISRRAPITSCRSDSDNHVLIAMPRTAVNAVSATRAAMVPAIADFQLRVTPIASTIVNASTNSTNDATNTALNSATVVASMSQNESRATVDGQHDSGEEARGRRQEERGGAAELLRLAIAAQGDSLLLVRPRCSGVVRHRVELLCALRVDAAGQQPLTRMPRGPS